MQRQLMHRQPPRTTLESICLLHSSKQELTNPIRSLVYMSKVDDDLIGSGQPLSSHQVRMVFLRPSLSGQISSSVYNSTPYFNSGPTANYGLI